MLIRSIIIYDGTPSVNIFFPGIANSYSLVKLRPIEVPFYHFYWDKLSVLSQDVLIEATKVDPCLLVLWVHIQGKHALFNQTFLLQGSDKKRPHRTTSLTGWVVPRHANEPVNWLSEAILLRDVQEVKLGAS